MESFRFQPGETPVLLNLPHVGTAVPADVAATMTEEALTLPDTDWHLDRLFHFAPALGIGFLKATCSRYVIDLNRDPSAPETGSTELCPVSTFDHRPIYKAGMEPDAAEIRRRTGAFWRPYHEQLWAELDALRERFGVAVLFDAHSVRSRVPRLFDGTLPDLNLCTGNSTTASPVLVGRLMCVLTTTERYSWSLDDRFKGGFITRRYGKPHEGVHAVQLTMSQRTYMNEKAPYHYRADRAGDVRPSLERVLGRVVEWAWSQAMPQRRFVRR